MIGGRGGVNEGIGQTIRQVPNGGPSQIGGLQAGQAGGTSSTRGTILQGLVTVGNDVVESGLGDQPFELGSCGDVHTALRDPIGLEAAAGADVEVVGDFVHDVLVIPPA